MCAHKQALHGNKEGSAIFLPVFVYHFFALQSSSPFFFLLPISTINHFLEACFKMCQSFTINMNLQEVKARHYETQHSKI